MARERLPSAELARRNTSQLMRMPYEAFIERLISDLHRAGFADLRPAHAIVFQLLRAEGSRATELAERAQLTKQYVGALIADLETLGYLERAPDPADGRARLVRLSERGRAVTRVAEAVIAAIEADWSRVVGDRRLRQLRRTLIDLIVALDPEGETNSAASDPGTAQAKLV